MAAKRELDALYPPAERAYDPFGLRPLFGMPLYEAPDPPPKIQLSKQVAELVGPDFAAQVNCWLLTRFGRRESMFDGGRAYMLAGFGLVTSKNTAAIIRSIVT